MLSARIRIAAVSLAVAAMTAGGVAPAALASHHHRHHRHMSHAGIPQHNGGDHDADNNGGPSDGDGGV
jgi:hypothetical protein